MLIAIDGDGFRLFKVDPVRDSAMFGPDFWCLDSFFMFSKDSNLGRFGAFDFGSEYEHISDFYPVFVQVGFDLIHRRSLV